MQAKSIANSLFASESCTARRLSQIFDVESSAALQNTHRITIEVESSRLPSFVKRSKIVWIFFRRFFVWHTSGALSSERTDSKPSIFLVRGVVPSTENLAPCAHGLGHGTLTTVARCLSTFAGATHQT